MDLAALIAEMYLTSVVESETDIFLYEFHTKHPSLNTNTWPDINFQVLGSFVKLTIDGNLL